LLRAAAKNSEHVAVLPDAASRHELRAHLGGRPLRVDAESARRWAGRAFRLTAAYDAAIAGWLADEPLPERLALGGRRELVLRYGENPHQRAAWYAAGEAYPFVRLHEGREISWNNLLDVEAAAGLAGEIEAAAAVV